MVKVESPDLSALVGRLEAASTNSQRDLSRFLYSQRRAIRTETDRAIRAVYTVKQDRVLSALQLGSVDEKNLSVSITGGKQGIGIPSFAGTRQLGGRRSPKGVRVQVLKKASPEVLKNAFTPASKKIPFQRETAQTKRLRIQPIYGPSLADMLNNPLVFLDLSRRFTERAVRELNRLITRAVEGRG